MGGARSTHGSDEKSIQFLIGNLKVRNLSEDLGVERKIILK
jgi:hypothetical protein